MTGRAYPIGIERFVARMLRRALTFDDGTSIAASGGRPNHWEDGPRTAQRSALR